GGNVLEDSERSADPEQKKIVEIKNSQTQSAIDHEQFFKDLEEATDGFAQ
ncbi:unnamed protein product, partial [Heterosigma akashiwo]